MLITPEYAELVRRHHERQPCFGTGAVHYVDIVEQLCAGYATTDVLDYGCGKGNLRELLGWPIAEYDPAIAEKSAPPAPADVVVCTSVLEHVEPQCLDAVLDDLRRVTLKAGFFVVPHSPACDTLPDGRNAHLTVAGRSWWEDRLASRFKIVSRAWMSSITSVDPHAMMIGSRTFFLVVSLTEPLVVSSLRSEPLVVSSLRSEP